MWMLHFQARVLVTVLVTLASSSSGDIVDKKTPKRTSDEAATVVTVATGTLRGKVVSTTKGKCNVYLGIPFAAPPVGRLRFQKPQPPLPWEGVLNATEFGPNCIQLGSNASNPKLESEDCLLLNVIVPERNSTAAYPVMFYIHGGSFTTGSPRDTGVDGACENLVSRGVIIVSVQYRLFLYGFLSTGSKAALGNYGIWDMVSALEWVRKNIQQFGGDPNKVTIFGQSAGAAAASLLTYVPAAKDLFHQAIMESGSALPMRVTPRISEKVITTTMELAEKANCSSANDSAVVDCLRQLSTQKLQEIYNSYGPKEVLATPWTIRFDGDLLTELKEQRPAKPVITGVTTLEIAPKIEDIPQARTLLSSTLHELFPGLDFKDFAIREVAHYAYIDAKGDKNEEAFLCQQNQQISNDNRYRVPAAKEAVSKAAAGSPVWVYKFDHYNENLFPPDYPFEKGAPHAHELCYLFLKPALTSTSDYASKCPLKYSGDHRIVADFMGEMWTNFAIKGNPSPSILNWPRFRNVTHANTLHIRNNVTILPDFYLDVESFWNDLLPNFERVWQRMNSAGQNTRSSCSK